MENNNNNVPAEAINEVRDVSIEKGGQEGHHHSHHHSHHSHGKENSVRRSDHGSHGSSRGSHSRHSHSKYRHSSSSSGKKRSSRFDTRIILTISIVLLVLLVSFVLIFEIIDRPKHSGDQQSTGQGNHIIKPVATANVNIREWDSPIYDANIPVFELSEEKPAMTDAECTPEALYAMYDALMAKHPQYITKTDLGLSSDGVNHVYRYDFKEPDSRHTEGFEWSETKTKAILVSGIHYEWSGMFGLYYALEEIADNPELYSFRRNTHLIVVPCVNPFATITENYKKSEGVKNANGVEIHRNFEIDWKPTDVSDKHHGGTEPLSEVETQYIDKIMKDNTDSALFLTCHSFAVESINFIWPSVATPYMCNLGYRLIDKMSNAWMTKYGDELIGLDDYRSDNMENWDNRLGYAHISKTNGTETKQATKYGIQGANVEINSRFWTHGTKADPEPSMSSFTMSRGAEVYVNFLLTAFGVYDPSDKLIYAAD